MTAMVRVEVAVSGHMYALSPVSQHVQQRSARGSLECCSNGWVLVPSSNLANGQSLLLLHPFIL